MFSDRGFPVDFWWILPCLRPSENGLTDPNGALRIGLRILTVAAQKSTEKTSHAARSRSEVLGFVRTLRTATACGAPWVLPGCGRRAQAVSSALLSKAKHGFWWMPVVSQVG